MTPDVDEIAARRRFPELRWQADYVIWRGPLMANAREAYQFAEAAKSLFSPCVTDEGAPALRVETADGSIEVCELTIPASDWNRGMSPIRRYDLSPIQFAERVVGWMAPKSAADPIWIGRIEIAGNTFWQYPTDDEASARRVAEAELHRRFSPSAKEMNARSSAPWWPIIERNGNERQVRDEAGFVVSCATEAEAWRHAVQAMESAVVRVEAVDLPEPIIPADVELIPAVDLAEVAA